MLRAAGTARPVKGSVGRPRRGTLDPCVALEQKFRRRLQVEPALNVDERKHRVQRESHDTAQQPQSDPKRETRVLNVAYTLLLGMFGKGFMILASVAGG
jgi:hypothetical protein